MRRGCEHFTRARKCPASASFRSVYPVGKRGGYNAIMYQYPHLRRRSRCESILLATVALSIIGVAFGRLGLAAEPARKPDASDALFDRGEIPHLRIEIAPEEMTKLRAENRAYVRCTVKENERVVYKDVAIKLK